ncbi:MAG: HAD family hydrolase, partial [Spirochaetota bacterium]
MNHNQTYTGLAVFDVDGVIYRDIFLKRVAQATGFKNYLRALLLGWRYYTNTISFKKLLAKSYKIIESVNASRALEIADDIKKFTNIKETIRILHRNNYFVSIISSGIPTFVLKKLGQEIYADYCSGLEVTIEQDRIWINPHNNQSKDRIVEKLLGRLGLNWDRVVSVGDDPTNVDLIKKSRLGIGFNPSRVVRKYADVIVEGYDLLELIPYIIPEHRVPRHLTKKQFTIKREIYRKKIHFLGVLVPLGAYLDKHTTVQFLLAVIFLYT